MKFILFLGNWLSEWPLVKDVVPVAEEEGFWGAVLPDHYMSLGSEGRGSLDAWTELAYLSAKTTKLQLGTLVTPIPFRPPSILAKIVSTLGVLSNGRSLLGVGAGWMKSEFDACSEWGRPGVRVDKTEEGVRLILQLWTRPTVNFQGQYYQSKNAVLEPKPVQQPHPPLLFGGEGERMLRMAGKLADICFIPPWVEFGEALKIANTEAKRLKRQDKLSLAAGAPSTHGRYFGTRYTRRRYTERVEEAANAGCKYFVVSFPMKGFKASLKRFAREIMPSFKS